MNTWALVTAFGLSNNDADGGCSFLAVYRQASGSSRCKGRRPSGTVLHSSREPGVRRPCSDFMDVLRRLINCRIIIIIIILLSHGGCMYCQGGWTPGGSSDWRRISTISATGHNSSANCSAQPGEVSHISVDTFESVSLPERHQWRSRHPSETVSVGPNLVLFTGNIALKALCEAYVPSAVTSFWMMPWISFILYRIKSLVQAGTGNVHSPCTLVLRLPDQFCAPLQQ